MADRAPRFFAAEIPAAGEALVLSDAAFKHARVLRLREGAAVEVFDAVGQVATAAVGPVERRGLTVRIEAVQRTPPPPRRLCLLLGLTKGEKPDLVVRMATEIGVSAIRFVHCERSVVIDRGRDHRMARLRQITVEACGQSGNPHAPALYPPASLGQAVSEAPRGALRLAFWERALSPPPAVPSAAEEVWAVVGPEGGLSEAEMNFLQERAFVPCALQTPILRAETAALVVAARLSAQLASLNG